MNGQKIDFVQIDEYAEISKKFSPLEISSYFNIHADAAIPGTAMVSLTLDLPKKTNFKDKVYMMFASDIKEVAQIMEHIELKGVADKMDIRTLAALGMPLFCCFEEHHMQSIYFEVLDKKLIEFAEQPRFTKARERFYQQREHAASVEFVRSGLYEFFAIIAGYCGLVSLKIVRFFAKILTKI